MTKLRVVLEAEGFDQTTDTWKKLTYIGFGDIEEDRFACLMSSFDGGEIETVPFVIQGDKLCLNCISRFGELVVKFVGSESGTSEEVIVTKDGTAVEIPVPKWARKEKTSLHFTLKNAKLYSYCAY